jgi:hypothetical protein
MKEWNIKKKEYLLFISVIIIIIYLVFHRSTRVDIELGKTFFQMSGLIRAFLTNFFFLQFLQFKLFVNCYSLKHFCCYTIMHTIIPACCAGVQCTAHPHNRLVCCHDIDNVMNDEDIEP